MTVADNLVVEYLQQVGSTSATDTAAVLPIFCIVRRTLNFRAKDPTGNTIIATQNVHHKKRVYLEHYNRSTVITTNFVFIPIYIYTHDNEHKRIRVAGKRKATMPSILVVDTTVSLYITTDKKE